MVKSTLLENRMKAFLLRRSAFDTPLQLRSWIRKINIKAESYSWHRQINIKSLQRIREDFIRSIQYFTGSRVTISSLNTWKITEYNRDVPVKRRLSASCAKPFLTPFRVIMRSFYRLTKSLIANYFSSQISRIFWSLTTGRNSKMTNIRARAAYQMEFSMNPARDEKPKLIHFSLHHRSEKCF